MSSYSSSNDQYDHSQSESDHSGSDSSILSEDDNDIDNPEMLTLNLAFGNKTDTIQVHWNDDPEDLARMFVKKHGLKLTSVNRIRDHISAAVEQYRRENSELRPQSPTLDQSFDDDDHADRNLRDRYRQAKEGVNSFDPVDLPNQRQTTEIPSRELRLSASTVDLPSSRTISTVTNPEYGQSQSISAYRSENQVDNDHSDEDEQPGAQSIAQLLSKTLSQEIDVKDQAQANQYLQNILRGIDNDGKNHRMSQAESLSRSISPESGYDSRHWEEKHETRDFVDEDHDQELMNKFENVEYSGDPTDVNSEISDNSLEEHETVLDLSNTLETTRIGSNETDNANLYERLKRQWGVGKKKSNSSAMKTVNGSTSSGKLRNTIVFSKSPLSSKPPQKAVNLAVERTADRLLHYGEIIEKRREWKRDQYLQEEKNEMEANKFKLSKKSRQVTRHISYANKSSNINERLYEEGLKKRKKKEKEVLDRDEEKKSEITSWSCIQCGTFHDLDYTTRKSLLNGNVNLKCTSCGTECNQEPYTFHPTNNAPIQSDRVEYRRPKGEGIHQHLHENASHQAKRVQLLQRMWGESDQDNTFCPVVPQSSKEILEKHKRKGNRIPMRSLSSVSSGKNSILDPKDHTTKISVSQIDLDEYISLPVTERLWVGETLSRQGISLESEIKKEIHSPRRKKEEIDETITRLTYEYVEKETKRREAEEQLTKYDPKTKKKYFQPTIPSSTSRRESPVIVTKSEPIHDKLLRKGVEHQQNLQQLKEKFEINKQQQLEKNKHRSLPRSLTILEDSFHHNNEEIYKILIAHQQIAKKEDDPGTSNTSANNSHKLIAEKLSNESKELSNWQTQLLEVHTIDPKLLSKDIRDLVAKVKETALKRSKKSNSRVDSPADPLVIIDFNTFETLMDHVLKTTRDGPGKSYLVVPKPRGEVTKALIEQEKNEISFHPTLTKHTLTLAKRRGRTTDKSIVDILINEGEYSKKQAQKVKEQVDSEFLKECSFKPHLYPHPRNIIPTYRGQSKHRISKHEMDDPNISSIDPILHQTPSMLSTGQFGDSLQFNSTTTTTNSNSSKPQPITISRLSQSNITKALLSYDQNDDHHAPSDSDKYTEYTEEMPIAPSHKDITPFNSKKNDYDRENMAYLLSDEDEDDHERIDERLPIAPPPPFSSLTSSFTIHDLQDDQTIPPPPLTPPPPPYHYSTTGEIDPSATSPLQQSVIQRIQTKKAAHRVL